MASQSISSWSRLVVSCVALLSLLSSANLLHIADHAIRSRHNACNSFDFRRYAVSPGTGHRLPPTLVQSGCRRPRLGKSKCAGRQRDQPH